MVVHDTHKQVTYINKLANDIYSSVTMQIPSEWLSSDLTVAQLRVMLLLHNAGPCRMSDIANILHIALSTATGIVDNLVKKTLVLRETDTQDRRRVICRLSPLGKASINNMWNLGRVQMENLLEGLTEEELDKAVEVAEILLNNSINNNRARDILTDK